MVQQISTWEYRVEFDLPLENLAELGSQGWELIETRGTGYIFKRPALTLVERVTLEQRAHYYSSLGLDSDAAK